MICTETQPRFRLLDGNVGWDPHPQDSDDSQNSSDSTEKTHNFLGILDGYGLRLNNRGEPRISSQVLSPFMPPAWLAAGCRLGEWFVCGQQEDEAVLLQRDPCCSSWVDWQIRLGNGDSLQQPIAVAAMPHRLAVVDKRGDCHRVLIWSIPEGRLAGVIMLPEMETPHAVAFAPWRELIVSIEDEQGRQSLLRYDMVGQYRGKIGIRDDSAGTPSESPMRLVRLRTARDGSLWAAECESGRDGPFHLWRIAPAEPSADPDCGSPTFVVKRMTDAEFYHDADERLGRTFERTRLVAVNSDHFCIDEPTPDGVIEEQCFDRLTAVPPAEVSDERASSSSGVLVTEAIDSFIPRCRWHRVRVEAEVPPGTSYQLEFATNEIKQIPEHDDYWTLQHVEPNATDLLLDQPPGRYLFVRVRLTGAKDTTPVIHRIRIDFPRATSLDQLPVVYRDNAEAEDFTERFLSLFDAAMGDMDRAIERFPALFDPDGVPEEALSWLEGFLGIVADTDWDVDLRRRLLNEVPRLYHKRGTIAGLQEVIALVCGDSGDNPNNRAVIDERAFHRAWGVVNHSAVLGSVRLFGKSESRFRVGRSVLGAVPVRSFGNPDHDPVRQDAHRFTVLIPPTPAVMKHLSAESLNRLVEHQKPAHTRHSVRIGGQGFVLGHRSAIGIDTQFVVPPPVVLSGCDDGKSQPVRLGAGTLRAGPHRPTSGLRPGVASSIGIHTLLE